MGIFTKKKSSHLDSTLSVRMDPKLRYMMMIACRITRMSEGSFIRWALLNELKKPENQNLEKEFEEKQLFWTL